MRDRRPNIFLIIAHDLGTHCGCYGAGLDTPNIDGLAAEGRLFTDYHCTAAQCSPSRGSIITGRYPHNHGLVGLTWGWELRHDVPRMPALLADAGYSTHLFGVQHETDHGRADLLGYQQVEATGAKATDLAEQAAQWLRARASSGDGRPFYASLGTAEPHRPYNREGYRNDDPAEVTPLPYLPDRPAIRYDIAGLNGLVYAYDDAVGIVRRALEDSGLAENTIFIVTTDHGIGMPRAKCTCYDPGTRTTMVMRMAGRWDDGAVHDELLTNCDLMPTLLEAAGVSAPEGIDGRSFLGLLDGSGYEPRADIFTEMTYHGVYNPMRCVRTPTHKYIRNFGELPLVCLPVDIWEGPAGIEMRDEYNATARPEQELYDLTADPWEQTNLAADPEHAETLADLSGRVDRWMQASGDLLLQGRWPSSPQHSENMRARLNEERFREWLARMWPEQVWFVDGGQR